MYCWGIWSIWHFEMGQKTATGLNMFTNFGAMLHPWAEPILLTHTYMRKLLTLAVVAAY
jgi:hypothetical protein